MTTFQIEAFTKSETNEAIPFDLNGSDRAWAEAIKEVADYMCDIYADIRVEGDTTTYMDGKSICVICSQPHAGQGEVEPTEVVELVSYEV